MRQGNRKVAEVNKIMSIITVHAKEMTVLIKKAEIGRINKIKNNFYAAY